MAFGAALDEDYGTFFPDVDNDFVTAVAPPSSGGDGKSPRTDFGHMVEEAQYVTPMPDTIDPTVLRQGYSFTNPAEEEISPSLVVRASSHSSNLRGTESQPRQELLPQGQVWSPTSAAILLHWKLTDLSLTTMTSSPLRDRDCKVHDEGSMKMNGRLRSQLLRIYFSKRERL